MYKSSHKHKPDTPKIGVLLTNLGTPNAPTKKAVRPYLKEFLSDPRVVQPPPPRWLWMLILNGYILNTRPKKSAKAYQSVWKAHGEGSPLLDISIKQKNAVELELNRRAPDQFIVALGMRYGKPSIGSALQELESSNCDRVVVLPLYPQHASSTTDSTHDAVSEVIQGWQRAPELKFISSYSDDDMYIQTLAKSVEDFQKVNGTPDLLLMSYHGIPRRYFENGDNYPCECCKTSHLLATKLKLEGNDYKMTFQSKLGRGEWIKDYTDETLKSLPSKGIKNVQVICPGFAADCLETIEEVGHENKAQFMNAGGETYKYIPALNDRVDHIDCLSQLIFDQIEQLNT